MFFTFPEDARWNAESQAVEFGVEIGEYRRVVRVSRRVFQRLRPPPSDASRRATSSSTRFESIAERKAALAPVDRGWECRDQRAGLRPSAR